MIRSGAEISWTIAIFLGRSPSMKLACKDFRTFHPKMHSRFVTYSTIIWWKGPMCSKIAHALTTTNPIYGHQHLIASHGPQTIMIIFGGLRTKQIPDQDKFVSRLGSYTRGITPKKIGSKYTETRYTLKFHQSLASHPIPLSHLQRIYRSIDTHQRAKAQIHFT